MRRLEDKDVMKYCKRHEAYVGARTTEALIDSFLAFSTKALGLVVKLKDPEALKNELKNDYIISKELSTLSGGLALKCGHLLAFANSVLISAKHVDFSRDSDGFAKHVDAEEPRLDADKYKLLSNPQQMVNN